MYESNEQAVHKSRRGTIIGIMKSSHKKSVYLCSFYRSIVSKPWLAEPFQYSVKSRRIILEEKINIIDHTCIHSPKRNCSIVRRKLTDWLHSKNQARNDKFLFSPGWRKANTCPNLFCPSQWTFSPGSTVKTKLRMTKFCFLLELRRFLLAGEKQIQAQIRFLLALGPFLLAPK